MSYIPTQWNSGDTVTSAKLNKMESGIANAGGFLVVHGERSEETNEAEELVEKVTLDKWFLWCYFFFLQFLKH